MSFSTVARRFDRLSLILFVAFSLLHHDISRLSRYFGARSFPVLDESSCFAKRVFSLFIDPQVRQAGTQISFAMTSGSRNRPLISLRVYAKEVIRIRGDALRSFARFRNLKSQSREGKRNANGRVRSQKGVYLRNQYLLDAR